MATQIEPVHLAWILLATLLLWLLATAGASAAGWDADEPVRYRTYRSGDATPPPAAPGPEWPAWVRLALGEGVEVWVEPWLYQTPGSAWTPSFAPLVGFPPLPPWPARAGTAPPPATAGASAR